MFDMLQDDLQVKNEIGLTATGSQNTVHLEVQEGIEPPYKDLQSSASPLRHWTLVVDK